VVFLPSGMVHKRWFFTWISKKFNWNDIESVHAHFSTMKAADKSEVYLVKINFKDKSMLKAVFRDEERAVDVLKFMREKNNTFPVGYSKSSREVSYILRKAGIVR
jgi:hypothetical protein